MARCMGTTVVTTLPLFVGLFTSILIFADAKECIPKDCTWKWNAWSPCTGNGTQKCMNHVVVAARCGGKCPKLMKTRRCRPSSEDDIYVKVSVGVRKESVAKGEKGSPARNRTRGETGPKGDRGLRGLNGAPGARGPKGEKGTRGPTGATGVRGPKGAKGSRGPTGARGVRGPRGYRGLRGPTGARGVRGLKGAKGSRGPTGARGVRGPRGYRGVRGPTGTRGQRGPQGRNGRNGARGATGSRGPRGYRGLKGQKGVSATRLNPRVSSCRVLKSRYRSLVSGVYELTLPSGKYQAYCEMAINGGGYTFISRKMATKMTSTDLSRLFRNKRDVLLRIARTDGTQPFTVIKQYQYSGGLSVQLSRYNGNSRPVNYRLGSYIYLGTLPSSIARGRSRQGFYSNNRAILYNNCGRAGTNYFAFFPNRYERSPSSYHGRNLVYERSGVAVNWRRSAAIPNSGSRIPLDFFLFTEMHYGGCGCYTSSDRWLRSVSKAIGTAIGIR